MKKKVFFALTILMIMSLLCLTAFATYESGTTHDTNGNPGSTSCEAYLNFNGSNGYAETVVTNGPLPYQVTVTVWIFDTATHIDDAKTTGHTNYDQFSGEHLAGYNYTTAVASKSATDAHHCESSHGVVEYGGTSNPSGDYYWGTNLYDD